MVYYRTKGVMSTDRMYNKGRLHCSCVVLIVLMKSSIDQMYQFH